jgi:hypothetical protein
VEEFVFPISLYIRRAFFPLSANFGQVLKQYAIVVLQQMPAAGWQKGYEAGTRVRARIIYVDPVSKRVCLSLLPHLLAGISSPALPPINTLFQVCRC